MSVLPVTCTVGLITPGASLVPWRNTVISSEQGELVVGTGRDSDFVECKMSGLISQLQRVRCLSKRSRIRQKSLLLGGVFRKSCGVCIST